jgi:transcriptional regulator with XRE-family HTH domain
MEKQLKIGRSIINSLKESTVTDTEIAKKVSVSRLSVYKWKTGKAESIRQNHLKSLAELLDKKVVVFKGTAELEPLSSESYQIKTISKESTMGSIETTQLINSLVESNKDLLNDKSRLRKENQYLVDKIDQLGITIENLSKRPQNTSSQFTIQEDYETYQVIVTASDNKIINCTKLYAQLYGKSVDEIKETPVHELIHEDDMWRLQVSQANVDTESENSEKPSTWKIPCGKEDFYMASTFINLEKEGLYKINTKMSDKKSYLETDKYYKKLAESK